MKRTGLGLSTSIICLAASQTFAQTAGVCTAQWDTRFGLPGVDDTVWAAVEFDDGHGPSLFVTGEFRVAGSVYANRIARLDGKTQQWCALGSGLTGSPGFFAGCALTVFDDGKGPALYVGGSFYEAGGISAPMIAKWDGESWSTLGGGMDGPVWTLAVFDEDGAGPNPSRLFAGGDFLTAGGVSAPKLARWDGSAWSAVGGSFPMNKGARVQALHVFDDGTGPALFVGGNFSHANTTPADRLAKWNGSSWSEVGGGLLSDVYSLTSIDAGQPGGPMLFVGGRLYDADGMLLNEIARWDGATWSSMGGGMEGSFHPSVNALLLVEESPGTQTLYAGGQFDTAGGVRTNAIARWDGANWSPAPAPISFTAAVVMTLAMFDDGSGDGPRLIIGGNLDTAGVARLNGTVWEPLGDELGPSGPVSVVKALPAVAGADASLYAGGYFRHAGPEFSVGAARWDGQTWHSMHTGNPQIGPVGAPLLPMSAFEIFNDGSGAALFLGGGFTSIGGVEARNIARFDGTNWSAAGILPGSGSAGQLRALCAFDDGAGGGTMLYGGADNLGSFMPTVARYDGSTWSEVGTGLDGEAWSLVTFNDPTPGGPALFAGGYFSINGGPALGVAKWDGKTWTQVGATLSAILALHVYDDGSGPALYAGGLLNQQGVVKWNGEAWTSLGPGLNGVVYCLATFDDGSGNGPELYAGGDITIASGGQGLAKWNGQSWSAVLGGVTGSSAAVQSMSSMINPITSARELYVAGRFNGVGDIVSPYLARLHCIAMPCPANIIDTGSSANQVDVDDLIAVILGWGCTTPPGKGGCPADVDDSGAVDVDDLIAVILGWGACS